VARLQERCGSIMDESTVSPFAARVACGVGFIARQSGERTHEIVALALQSLAPASPIAARLTLAAE
jgi:hypothetical protein